MRLMRSHHQKSRKLLRKNQNKYMDNKFVSGILVVAVLGLLGVSAFKNTTVTVNNPAPEFGAVSTNTPTESFYFQGGSTGKVANFVSTTTVACMIQNTTNATTTFTARWMTTAATTTTTVLGIATSTHANRFSTSTAVTSFTVVANAQGAGSYVGGNNQNIIGPNDWVQIGYGSGTTLPLVAQQQTGFCSVEFGNIK